MREVMRKRSTAGNGWRDGWPTAASQANHSEWLPKQPRNTLAQLKLTQALMRALAMSQTPT